jgi:hypothetical protein
MKPFALWAVGLNETIVLFTALSDQSVRNDTILHNGDSAYDLPSLSSAGKTQVGSITRTTTSAVNEGLAKETVDH